MIELKKVVKKFNTIDGEKVIFDKLDLKVEEGEFISVVGGNGAGKSTFMNMLTGDLEIEEGEIIFDNNNIEKLNSFKRKRFISKVYQEPSKGTSSNMTVFENLSMADNKGKRFGLSLGLNKKRKSDYIEALKELELGLEEQLNTEVGLLSGGQRQAISLTMATLKTPKLLLLDEHTSALDPKTSKIIMEQTKNIVEKNKLTTIMITHNLKTALEYGNRLIMLDKGKIVLDIKGKEKETLTVECLLKKWGQF
ncbi:ABC transporter ATP-binding protein [Oceanirhabdus seepicola]|uniref:ATP-binding cassette domain-containing protein n=1 Tax=Oceanirhabdus seepicola TaxID=2828781 RepID=A0A9J6PAE8_9CLOT|nr:ATP-binding cassette domain-containing protein [Oceanirhabdus seepicola]MCM1992200.1 ATP-binding cassette domain-containing protein [Oceanirhabdus seepicola]